MCKITKSIVAGFVAVVALAAVTGSAQAGDNYCSPGYVLKKVTCYETVTTYECQRVPYTVCVTRYDHCGTAYTVHETRYREVRVAVTHSVPVTQYVKVAAY